MGASDTKPPGPLALRSVTPNHAPTSGGTKILVRGQGFRPGILFAVDNLSASVVVNSDTELSVVVPPRPGAFGRVKLRAVNPGGEEAVHDNLFSYYTDRLRLAPRVDYAVGKEPSALAIGDVDADGNLDLVVSNQSSGTFNVFSGSGFGAFSRPQGRSSFDTCGLPYTIRLADVSGDSRPDLLVGCVGDGMINVFLGQPGGAFQRSAQIAGYGPVISVASGDISGRGKGDLAALLPGTQSLALFPGDSAGNFGSPLALITTGISPARVVSGDLNSDGKPDVVVANSGSASLGVYLATGDKVEPLRPMPVVAVGASPQWVELGDWNGDRILDLVASHAASNDLSVHLGKGDGSFKNRQDYPVGQGPVQVSSVDINGDGNLDLVVANSGSQTISVLLGAGDGTFVRRTDFPANAGPRAVVAGLLNDDQKPDLAVVNQVSGNVSVYLNISE